MKAKFKEKNGERKKSIEREREKIDKSLTKEEGWEEREKLREIKKNWKKNKKNSTYSEAS